MLPFLKKEASVVVPSDHIKRDPDEDQSEFDPMMAVADDLIAAVHSRDSKGVCEALQAAFGLYEDSEPKLEEAPK